MLALMGFSQALLSSLDLLNFEVRERNGKSVQNLPPLRPGNPGIWNPELEKNGNYHNENSFCRNVSKVLISRKGKQSAAFRAMFDQLSSLPKTHKHVISFTYFLWWSNGAPFTRFRVSFRVIPQAQLAMF